MNAPGMLGFAPDFHSPLPWDQLGAFVTNPVSLRPRQPAGDARSLNHAGSLLLHTGLPNPGFRRILDQFSRRWSQSRLPVIPHLMADRPEETARMVRALEPIDNILGVELGFAPHLADDILLISLEMSLGELPLIVSLQADQLLRLGPHLVQMGAGALSLAAPRGVLPDADGKLVTGRLYGPAWFPLALESVHVAARIGLPVIGAGGIYSTRDAQAMLEAGALAVQLDTVLWTSLAGGDWSALNFDRPKN